MSAFRLQTVVETAEFIRQVSYHLSDEERKAFINYIAASPTKGDIIPETGGARKIRWAKAGKGKSGGIRIIYFYYDDSFPIFLFTAYGKNERANLTMLERKSVKNIIKQLVNTYQEVRK